MKGILAKKLGMTQFVDEHGGFIPVTVVQAGPCIVLERRTKEKDGYTAVQVAYGKRKLKNVSKAVKKHIAKADMKDFAPAWIRELPRHEDPQESVGDSIQVDIFSVGDYVDIKGTSKGKGFQGVVKRYGFSGGRASHGGDWMRKTGSIGMCETPGKVYKGRKMPGQTGNKQCTVKNLQIVQVNKEENLLLIKGAVPGPTGRFILIRQAKKDLESQIKNR